MNKLRTMNVKTMMVLRPGDGVAACDQQEGHLGVEPKIKIKTIKINECTVNNP